MIRSRLLLPLLLLISMAALLFLLLARALRTERPRTALLMLALALACMALNRPRDPPGENRFRSARLGNKAQDGMGLTGVSA